MGAPVCNQWRTDAGLQMILSISCRLHDTVSGKRLSRMFSKRARVMIFQGALDCCELLRSADLRRRVVHAVSCGLKPLLRGLKPLGDFSDGGELRAEALAQGIEAPGGLFRWR